MMAKETIAHKKTKQIAGPLQACQIWLPIDVHRALKSFAALQPQRTSMSDIITDALRLYLPKEKTNAA